MQSQRTPALIYQVSALHCLCLHVFVCLCMVIYGVAQKIGTIFVRFNFIKY